MTDEELLSIFSKTRVVAMKSGDAAPNGGTAMAGLRAVVAAVEKPLQDRIAELQRQLDTALEERYHFIQDAIRYRWLKQQFNYHSAFIDGTTSFTLKHHRIRRAKTIDEAVDKGMKQFPVDTVAFP